MVEAVSDAITALADKPPAEIKAHPSDKIFRPEPNKELGEGNSAARGAAQDATPLELKVRPADTLLRPASRKLPTSEASPSLFRRALRNSARAAAVVSLCGLAWAVGAYSSHRHLSVDLFKVHQVPQAQQNSAQNDMASAVQRMAQEIDALKAAIASGDAAREAGLKSLESQKSAAAQTAAGPTTADLAGRVDKLEAELTAKLSEINEQLATIQQQTSASASALASREHAIRRRAEHFHDAFDPSRDPTAPGAPRPLGSR